MMNKRGSTLLILLVVIICGLIIYFTVPGSFWNSIGSQNYKSPYHNSAPQVNGGPTPVILQFRDPFKYDKYEPSKKDEFLKDRDNNSKKLENKSPYWK